MIRPGSYMLEVLLSVAVLAIMAVGLGGLLASSHRTMAMTRMEQQAAAYAKEGMEIAVAQKIRDWTTMTPGVRPTESLVGGFERTLDIEPGRRAAGVLDQSGPTIDDNVRLLHVTVGWSDRTGSHHVTYDQYVTKW